MAEVGSSSSIDYGTAAAAACRSAMALHSGIAAQSIESAKR